jgi:hypothetical protein
MLSQANLSVLGWGMGQIDDLRGELAALERAAERVRAEIDKLGPRIRFGSDLDGATPVRFGDIRFGDATGYPGSPPARADLSDVHFYLNGERQEFPDYRGPVGCQPPQPTLFGTLPVSHSVGDQCRPMPTVGFIRGSDGAVLDSDGKVVFGPHRCPTCGSRGTGGPRLCGDRWHGRFVAGDEVEIAGQLTRR